MFDQRAATADPDEPAGSSGLFASPTDRLDWVLSQPPSSVTLAALESLEQASLTPADRVLAAVAWARQRAATAARALAATAAATTSSGSFPVELLEAELALAVRESDQTVARLAHYAHRLVDVLPHTFDLLSAAEITERHAAAMHELTLELTDEQASTVDAEVAHRATTTTPSGFRRLVRKAAARVDRRSAKDRHRAAKKNRSGARLYPEPDGMTTVAVTMPACDGVAALNALNVSADRIRTPADERTHGERQVAAFLDAVLARPATGDGKLRARRRTEVSVVIDWASLVGLRDNPAELRGYGPVSAQAVRDLLGDDGTVLRRLVTDTVTGVLVDYGRSRYVADDHLRRLTEARDVTCRYPGCTRNAVWCDIEHCVPYDEGGATSCANCGLMCRKHHRRKTLDGFRYTRPDPATGETVWTTPLGFTYRQTPATYDDDGIDVGDVITETNPSRRSAERPP